CRDSALCLSWTPNANSTLTRTGTRRCPYSEASLVILSISIIDPGSYPYRIPAISEKWQDFVKRL
ncbi:MAG TPA: hypothetical protein VJ761_20125, partial [Ktedonobacteraceae bacterium]|nr:hypothetical protein [Ktedonobacteraceae bacterium]